MAARIEDVQTPVLGGGGKFFAVGKSRQCILVAAYYVDGQLAIGNKLIKAWSGMKRRQAVCQVFLGLAQGNVSGHWNNCAVTWLLEKWPPVGFPCCFNAVTSHVFQTLVIEFWVWIVFGFGAYQNKRLNATTGNSGNFKRTRSTH